MLTVHGNIDLIWKFTVNSSWKYRPYMKVYC